MAPSFDHLPDPEEEDYDEDEELDFSDLRERFEVQLEQGLDAFVVIDGLPEVTEETKPKLIKFLLRKLNAVGKVREDSVHMPLGEDGKSERYEHTRPTPTAVLIPLDMPSSSIPPQLKLSPHANNWTVCPLTKSTLFESTSSLTSNDSVAKVALTRNTQHHM